MSMDERPDLDTLADYLEDLLDTDAQLEVERWIERDPPTAELVRELRNLPALLAAEPVGPMPSDVAERVDAALASEAERADGQGAPVTALPAQRRRRWLAPALVAAAAVGVVGIGAQVVGTGGLDAGGGAGSMADTAADTDPLAAAPEQDAAAPRAESTSPPDANSDGGGEESGGRSQRPADHAALVTSVSAQTFPRDVLRVVRTQGLSQVVDGGTLRRDWEAAGTNGYSIVDDDCGADLGRGRFAAIRLDGEPALLVLRRVPGQPRQREAAAYPARCPRALVDTTDMTLPALVRATIRLP